MSYGNFKEVAGTIAEREYCISDKVVTTAVTSCMIVVARVGTKLFGVHLSVFGESDAFGVDDADKVGQIMKNKGADLNGVHLFGELDFWGSSIPGYNRLMALLGNPGSHRQHQKSGCITVTNADLG
jgi:hypothetical protein